MHRRNISNRKAPNIRADFLHFGDSALGNLKGGRLSPIKSTVTYSREGRMRKRIEMDRSPYVIQTEKASQAEKARIPRPNRMHLTRRNKPTSIKFSFKSKGKAEKALRCIQGMFEGKNKPEGLRISEPTPLGEGGKFIRPPGVTLGIVGDKAVVITLHAQGSYTAPKKR